MSWLAPASLIALAPLAGIIILLYLLKLRRRETIVPSVFLWRQATEDVQANAPFQRLRTSLLLILQLMAVALLVLALAAPFVMARRLSGRTSVIVMDASASMGAVEVGGTRFEVARRRASELVRAMSGHDQLALVECAGRARVVVPLTGERRQLLSALERMAPTDCSGDIRDGLLLAMSLAARRRDATVYLVSDGAFDALPPVEGSAQVRFVGVGEGHDNVALLAFEASRPAGSTDHQLFVRVRNCSDRARECLLSLYLEDRLLDARRLELAAGESRAETHAATIPEAGLLRAQIEVDDALAADNVAWASAVPPASRSVLLVTPGNLFLEQALLVLPEVEVFRTAALTADQAVAAYAEHDLVVFDRVDVPAAPVRGAVMVVAAEAWPELCVRGKQLAAPQVSRWDQEHPVLRYVNLGAASLASVRELQPGESASTIAWASDAPVMVAAETPELRALAVGFDLLDSDLPLRVGFPVMLSNTVRWLTDVGARHELTIGRPGQALVALAPPGTDAGTVTPPDGRRRSLDATSGEALFAEADRVGVYEMQMGEQRRRWALDLRDPAESDLTPRAAIELGGRRVAAQAGDVRAERHLWPWLAALALFLLLAEWHLYHRRY